MSPPEVFDTRSESAHRPTVLLVAALLPLVALACSGSVPDWPDPSGGLDATGPDARDAGSDRPTDLDGAADSAFDVMRDSSLRDGDATAEASSDGAFDAPPAEGSVPEAGPGCAGPTVEACGDCGRRERTCLGDRWSEFGPCEGQGVCAAGSSEGCGDGGTRTCGATCKWGTCVTTTCAGASSQSCGNCGTQTRTCTNGTWSAWSSCSGEGACKPNESRACSGSGTQTCNAQCSWGLCTGQTCVGATSQSCGNCGTQTRTCNNGAWSAWGACATVGVCSPNATQSCGSGGTQSCDAQCQWGSCTGQTCAGSGTRACGNCGTQTRSCNNGTWSSWSACGSEGDCAPAATEACGTGGTRTCSDTCMWGSCQGQTCSGATSEPCGNCGTRTRTCNNGTWSAWGACAAEGVCAPGATESCTGGSRTCSGSCAWGSCVTADAGSEAGADAGSDATVSTPVTLRVYVAGESIEEYNLWKSSPFLSDGSARSPSTNNLSEYGWMVPFADRLKARDSGVTLQWFGSRTWTAWSDPWNGTYPSAVAQPTSAYSGTTVERWLQYMGDELTNKTYCYDVAIAARGGNDVNESVSQSTFKAQLKLLLLALDAGSNCRSHPLILLTGHMPDNGGGGTDQAWVDRMQDYYVTWPTAVLADLQNTNPSVRVRFLDGYTGFVANQATTAFPSPSWLNGDGRPDLGKIMWDNYHPKRLASIYYGELLANHVDLTELRNIQ